MRRIDRYLYYIFAGLIPLQLYFPVAGRIDLPLAAISLFLILFNQRKRIFCRENLHHMLKNTAMLAFSLMCGLFILRLLQPGNILNGIKIVFFISLGPLIYFAFKDTDPGILKKMIYIALLVSVLPALVAMLQAFDQNLKVKLLALPVMRLFIEPDTLRGVVDGYAINNILQSGRGGGFFVNVNTASIYYNLLLGSIVYLTLRYGKFGFKLLSLYIIFILGVLSTSSSAGIAIMIIITVFFIYILLKRKIIKATRKRMIAFLSLILLLSIGLLIYGDFSRLIYGKVFRPGITRISKKLNGSLTSGRSEIWADSVRLLRKKWFAGYGYDNSRWAEEYLRYNSAVYPPHNIFLSVWMYTGAFGAILLLVFVFAAWLGKLNCAVSFPDNAHCILGLLIVGVIFLQGFTENLIFLNHRIDMLFWLLYAVSSETPQ